MSSSCNADCHTRARMRSTRHSACCMSPGTPKAAAARACRYSDTCALKRYTEHTDIDPARRLPAPRSGGRVEGRPPPQRPLQQDYVTLRRCKRDPTCLAGVAQARRRAEEVARVRLQSRLSHTCPDVLNKVLEDLRGIPPAAHPLPCRPSRPQKDVKSLGRSCKPKQHIRHCRRRSPANPPRCHGHPQPQPEATPMTTQRACCSKAFGRVGKGNKSFDVQWKGTLTWMTALSLCF